MKRLFGKKKEDELLNNEEALDEISSSEEVLSEEDAKKERDASIYSWVETFVMVPVIVMIIFAFFFKTSVVSGSSMYDTLEEGDMMLISNLFYEPEYGDIVVLTQPSYSTTDPLVKRVIATEGQTVDIDFARGVVIVDGEELSEPYTYTPTNNQYDVEFPITVKEGHIFVLGDNRNGSYDSRGASIGQIDKRMVMGKAYLRIMPFEKFGSLKFER